MSNGANLKLKQTHFRDLLWIVIQLIELADILALWCDWTFSLRTSNNRKITKNYYVENCLQLVFLWVTCCLWWYGVVCHAFYLGLSASSREEMGWDIRGRFDKAQYLCATLSGPISAADNNHREEQIENAANHSSNQPNWLGENGRVNNITSCLSFSSGLVHKTPKPVIIISSGTMSDGLVVRKKKTRRRRGRNTEEGKLKCRAR